MAKQTDYDRFLIAWSDMAKGYNVKLPNQYDRATTIRDKVIRATRGGSGWGGPIPPR